MVTGEHRCCCSGGWRRAHGTAALSAAPSVNPGRLPSAVNGAEGDRHLVIVIAVKTKAAGASERVSRVVGPSC